MNAMVRELKTYGALTLACHIFSKVTHVWKPYHAAKFAAIKKRNDIYSFTSEHSIPYLKAWWAEATKGGSLTLKTPRALTRSCSGLRSTTQRRLRRAARISG